MERNWRGGRRRFSFCARRPDRSGAGEHRRTYERHWTPVHLDFHVENFSEAVDRVLAALLGYFTYQGLQPDPRGLPTVRAFQRWQGDALIAWLRGKLG